MIAQISQNVGQLQIPAYSALLLASEQSQLQNFIVTGGRDPSSEVGGAMCNSMRLTIHSYFRLVFYDSKEQGRDKQHVTAILLIAGSPPIAIVLKYYQKGMLRCLRAEQPEPIPVEFPGMCWRVLLLFRRCALIQQPHRRLRVTPSHPTYLGTCSKVCKNWVRILQTRVAQGRSSHQNGMRCTTEHLHSKNRGNKTCDKREVEGLKFNTDSWKKAAASVHFVPRTEIFRAENVVQARQ